MCLVGNGVYITLYIILFVYVDIMLATSVSCIERLPLVCYQWQGDGGWEYSCVMTAISMHNLLLCGCSLFNPLASGLEV